MEQSHPLGGKTLPTATELSSLVEVGHEPMPVEDLANITEVPVDLTNGSGAPLLSTSSIPDSLRKGTYASAVGDAVYSLRYLHPGQQKDSPGILQLPTETLTQIFSYFQHPGIHKGKLDVHQIDMDFVPQRHKIQKIRLVCRVFNTIASQFLLPILHVWHNKQSLNDIQRLIQTPSLKSGLHAIQVHMEYYFIELAGNERKFLKFARDQAWTLTHRTTLDLDPSASTKRNLMLGRLYAMNSAAHHLLGGKPQDIFAEYTSDDKELIEEYKKMLKRAYVAYRAKYMAHREIIMDKSIIHELERLVYDLKHKHCLSLSFIRSSGQSLARGIEGGTNKVYESLTTTHIWEHIGQSRIELAGREFARQAESLWDLPIAIHKAGGSLTSFELADTLITKDYSLVCSKKLSLPFKGPADWIDLSKACESLETFRFNRFGYNFKLGDHSLPLVPNSLPLVPISNLQEELAFPIAEYLGVVLSGKHLKSITLNTSIEETSQYIGQRDQCPLGPVLAHLDCQFITTILVSNIGISQAHFEQLCQNISWMIEKISFFDIALIEGSWEDILNLLREKLMWRCSKGYCIIYIDQLSGGEIDTWITRIKEPSSPNDPDELEVSRRRVANKKIMQVLISYIDGSGVASNPIPIQNNSVI